MKLVFWIITWSFSLIPVIPVFAQFSVFSDAYSKWRVSTLLEKIPITIPTTIPGSEVMKATHHQKKYVLHKRVTEAVFAVEWLFEAENAQLNSDRSLEKQLAGMFLWALDNQFDNLLWSYANQISFKMDCNRLFYDREAHHELLAMWEKQQLNVHYESGNQLGYLYFLQQSDTVYSVEITPHLIDVFGSETDIFAEYLFTSLEAPTIPRLYTSYESQQVTQQLIGLQTKATDWEPEDRVWLTGEFNLLDYAGKTQLEVKIVTPDTLTYRTSDHVSETLSRLHQLLTAFGEKTSLGLLSESQQKTRLLALFTQPKLGYEHVVRIEQGRDTIGKTNTISMLVMVLNPLQTPISELENP